jgi:hypothetical protein
MGKGREPAASKRARRAPAEPPIPVEAVDLLAGLAPGVELCADPLPAGLGPEAAGGAENTPRLSVADTGRLLRSGDDTIRRLIRRPGIGPMPDGAPTGPTEVCRAGVPPRSRRRPGE